MNKKDYYDIAALLKRYLDCTATDSELQEVEAWLKENEAHEEVLNAFADQQILGDIQFMSRLDVDSAWETFERKRHQMKRRKMYYQMSAAAAVLVIMSIFFFQRGTPGDFGQKELVTHNQFKNDLSPADTKAVLHMSDGTTLEIGSGPFEVEEHDGTVIRRDDSSLTYHNEEDEKRELLYNKLVVPKAGTYSVTLSDGTQVFLNANSELQFPVTFLGNKRVVRLKGEGFFEVAHHPDNPFIVELENENSVRVYGTSFNVNAYSSNVLTSLVSGSVQVSNKKHHKILKPGESAMLYADSHQLINTYDVNLDKVLAWRHGDFYFKSDDMGMIMDELSRWYDVDVSFMASFSKSKRYTGSIKRDVNISEVLDMLSHVSGAQFILEGNAVSVQLKNVNK